MSVKYWAIIPAAGVGSRIQSDKPKQYLTLAGQPILQHVVNLFSSHPHIEKVIVVLHAKDHWWPSLQLSHPETVLTAIGGKERVHSVLLGLDFLSEIADKNDFVLVHDAARPCLQLSDMTKLMTELKNHSVGGLLGLPIVDTVKRVNKNSDVLETISREQLWRAQTPQCFRYHLLKSSIEKALSENIDMTDESSAMEYAGLEPKMIVGDVRNIKITFLEDLALAEKVLYP